jgi:hypothetical protein
MKLIGKILCKLGFHQYHRHLGGTHHVFCEWCFRCDKKKIESKQ